MKPDTKEVEEVVVTGYGNVRKTSFTGNSVTVSRDELLKVSKTNVMKALEVYDPSFRVKTNNQWGSDPIAGDADTGTIEYRSEGSGSKHAF